MSTIDIQFYALPEELFTMIEKWKQEFGFYLVVMKLFPEVATFEIESFDDMKQLPIRLEEIFSVFLGLHKPEINVKHRYDFLLKNNDFLTIDIGELNSEGLGESWVSGRTDDAATLAVWKTVARQLKKNTMAGLWAINTELGGKHFYKNTRYTVGACVLSQNGTKLLTHGSFVYCFIDKPCHDNK